jgi:hypothetical protein
MLIAFHAALAADEVLPPVLWQVPLSPLLSPVQVRT